MNESPQSPLSAPFWDTRYESSEFVFGTNPNDFLKESTPKLAKGSVILCLGEGEGRNAVFLAKQGFSVTAVDMSIVGLQKASRLAQEHSVSINTQVADLAQFEFCENCWNGIISIFCHLPPEIRPHVYQKVVKALKPGGFFILEAYTPRQLAYKTGGPSNPAMLYELEDLRTDLAGLEMIIAEEKIREIHEGSAHSGNASVVQILARK